jgi:WhiB family redox-sensing transcriptional regulator
MEVRKNPSTRTWDVVWKYRRGPGERPDWHKDAACRGMGAELFFPPRGQSPAAAKSICASCPVQRECLDFALTYYEGHGIWGGMSERGRRSLYQRRRTVK